MGIGAVDQVTGKKSMQMTDEEWQAEEEKKRAAAAARAQTSSRHGKDDLGEKPPEE